MKFICLWLQPCLVEGLGYLVNYHLADAPRYDLMDVTPCGRDLHLTGKTHMFSGIIEGKGRILSIQFRGWTTNPSRTPI